MQLSHFDYKLPTELIAQYPLTTRTDSRLLCLEEGTKRLVDRRFVDLPHLLRPGDLLVLNDTRVIPARLFGRKDTGGRVEVFVERFLDEHRLLAQIRSSKPARPGSRILIAGSVVLEVEGRRDDLFVLKVADGTPVGLLLERHGHVPLPPYIRRADQAPDRERYQTVYARNSGAIAAPTAGLHFDAPLLNTLGSKGIDIVYITLHVGAGTFQPVRVDDLDRHRMHPEQIEVSAQVCEAVNACRARNGRVVAVGTTVVRALETAALGGSLQPFSGDSRLFIRPGFGFRVIDALISNFHLPRSTLLMLVSAFGGHARVMAAYRHAVEHRYRFYSYGDAMYLVRNATPANPENAANAF